MDFQEYLTLCNFLLSLFVFVNIRNNLLNKKEDFFGPRKCYQIIRTPIDIIIAKTNLNILKIPLKIINYNKRYTEKFQIPTNNIFEL